MKKQIVIGIMLICQQLMAQTPNRPESIIYDSAHQRYLISNVEDGNTGSILAYDPETELYSYFNQAHTQGPKGLAIYENVLYVSDKGFVNGFNLDNGQRVFHKEVGTLWINDMVVDTSGFLYVGERDQEIVYKIDTRNGHVEEWIVGNLEEINGMWMDIENNRIVACFTRANSPIMEFDLATSQVSTIVETNYSGCDGIAVDNCGNYYFSSHGSNAIFCFDKNFSQPPEVFADGFLGPADIYFNQETQFLCIPEINNDRIIFIDVFQTCFAPKLKYPENNQEMVSTISLNLSWEPVFRVSYYRFEMAYDSDFTELVIVDGIGDPEYVVENLATNTRYYWRVTAYSQNQHTDYSETWTFVTEQASSDEKEALISTINLFPNPASNQITISWNKHAPIAIRVISTSGQLVHQFFPDSVSVQASAELQLCGLSPGNYYVMFIMPDHHIISKKIILM